MKNLIIGSNGEVGSSLMRVFLDAKINVQGIDITDKTSDIEPWPEYDFLHICIPYQPEFLNIVLHYERNWKKNGGITIIHSTVPVGTTRLLGAVHSPIHGIHPNLTPAIKTFIKYIGATNPESANTVLGLYNQIGIHGLIVKNPETSELSKLGCTTRHGLMIIEQKEFKRLCEKYGADFNEAYTLWNGFYSMGYKQLGYPYLQRPIVRDIEGPIGGHCIISNLDLMGGPVAKFVKERNKTFL